MYPSIHWVKILDSKDVKGISSIGNVLKSVPSGIAGAYTLAFNL